MTYKRLKISFKHCEENRFYRTMLVDENINLVDLGCGILAAFSATLESWFSYESDDIRYMPNIELIDSYDEHPHLLNYYSISDLANEFEFLYGEWEFDCSIDNEAIELDNDNNIMLVDGKGQGIWENNITVLLEYLKGNIKPDDIENTSKGYFYPWNVEVSKFGDFDTAFNLELENGIFNEIYNSLLALYNYRDSKYDGSLFYDYEQQGLPSFENGVIEAVEEQLTTKDYVKEIYDRLILFHTPIEAKTLIAAKLLEELCNMKLDNREFNEEKYKFELKKLW